jgi:nitroimidazol reductase NimA-like FMN-containing flavoprotein (pyridoxamine 5'-phosphate oxidase superfamily)
MNELDIGPIEVRTWLEILDREQCDALLAAHHVGRLAITIGAQPLVFPVNYAMHNGTVVFRTARGTKLFGAVGHAVAFEIDGVDSLYHRGWSVLVLGHAEACADPRERDDLEALPLQPWSETRKDYFVRIRPRAVTGRRIPPHTARSEP